MHKVQCPEAIKLCNLMALRIALPWQHGGEEPESFARKSNDLLSLRCLALLITATVVLVAAGLTLHTTALPHIRATFTNVRYSTAKFYGKSEQPASRLLLPNIWATGGPDTSKCKEMGLSGNSCNNSAMIDLRTAEPINELQGVLHHDVATYSAAIRRMRTWEHGLGKLKPISPADILVAAVAALRKGGQLRSDYGVGTEGAGIGPLGLQSYFTPWILADSAQWAHTGITKEMVTAAVEKEKRCHGSAMRVIVQNGTVWVDHFVPRPPGGWYPAGGGPYWGAAKARVPYVILAVMDTIREFGAQVKPVRGTCLGFA